MCVAAIAWLAHPRWQLIAFGNRDEYHERAAAPLGRWADQPGVIAGRDLQAGGTWMGVSEQGRFALVTNFRVPEGPQPGKPSRGALVTDWLARGSDPAALPLAPFNPFNLLVADRQRARFITNHPDAQSAELPPGVHGLSNGSRTPPWPKTSALTAALDRWLGGEAQDFGPLFAALRNANPLPGEGPEPPLSSVFIADPVYGTRCSTVMAIANDGRGMVIERSFDQCGTAAGETALDFVW